MRERAREIATPPQPGVPEGRSARPASARAAVRATRARSREDVRREGEARDRLHGSLDTLGDRVPSDADVYELVQLAGEAFHARTVACRLVVALTRHPSVQAVLAGEEEEEPEYHGDVTR